MFHARAFLFSAIVIAGCHDHAPEPSQPPAGVVAPGVKPHPTFPDQQPPPAPPKSAADVDIEKERNEFVTDAVEFTGMKREDALAILTNPVNTALKDEWNTWEKQGQMTDERIKKFYKQTKNYIWDLGAWHLWNAEKHASDIALAEQIKATGAKNVLDFGGGVGLNSIPMARVGLDVTLADLDSETIKFGKIYSGKSGVKLKFWKTDTEAAPPDAKYDVILGLDVFEHLPDAELKSAVDKLIKLKKPTTQVIIHAPFGKTSTHPMHLDLNDTKKHEIERLRTELPPA